MQSALTPREIQTRLRAGASVADVAAIAGVDEDYIDNFAGPVLAERENAARLAKAAQVRRRGEASSNRKLADEVLDKLATLGVEESAVIWDAWREPEKNWTVAVSWSAEKSLDGSDASDQTALFEFDQRGRFSCAKDALARILIGDQHAAKPRAVDPDSEPTIDLHDELALVRATQDSDPQRPAVVPDIRNLDELNEDTESIGRIVNAAASEHTDWSEPDLEQVDGIYQIAKDSNMDVLYEMLAGFNEDSVRIYTGLTKPPVEPQQATVTTQAMVRTTVAVPNGQPDTDPEGDETAATEPELIAPAAPDVLAASRVEQDVAASDEPTQDSLLGDQQPARPAKPKSHKKRASVPSWDEIMFGTPTQK